MKSVTTLFATFFLSLAIFANNNPSRLIITNLENTTLRIIVDGKKYDGIGNTLSLNDLSAGHHNIKVYKVRKGWWNSNQLVYSSTVFFKPNYQVNILISRSGEVSLAEQQSRGYGRKGDRDYGRNDDHDWNGRSSGDNRNGYPSGRH